MPNLAKAQISSLKPVLDAISVLAGHASAVTGGNPPPFAYGKQGSAAENLFSMTPGNAPPALVVWLFMVTANNFLNELETPTDPNGSYNQDKLPFDEIVRYTNLTPDCVKSLFACYLNDDDVVGKPQWRHVVSQFQAFAQAHSDGYDPDGCPNGHGIFALAVNGAAVDPNSLVPPPLP